MIDWRKRKKRKRKTFSKQFFPAKWLLLLLICQSFSKIGALRSNWLTSAFQTNLEKVAIFGGKRKVFQVFPNPRIFLWRTMSHCYIQFIGFAARKIHPAKTITKFWLAYTRMYSKGQSFKQSMYSTYDQSHLPGGYFMKSGMSDLIFFDLLCLN